MRPMYAVAILFLLAGCSSVPAEKTRAIPAERLLGYQQPVSGGGRLEVHRDYGYLGGGCYVADSQDARGDPLLAAILALALLGLWRRRGQGASALSATRTRA